MDMQSTVFIAIFGVLFCFVDAGTVKRRDFELGLDPSIINGNPSLTGSLGYKNGGFNANGHYTKNFGGQDSYGGNLGYNKGGFSTGVDYQGTKGYDRFGGHIGYEKNNFNIKGTGFRDNFGNYGIGASLGWRFRRSLRKPMEAFYLRVEADPCQFILYDRDADGVITIEELEEVFPDRNLADGLFQRLDIEERGEITLKEFEAAKASGAIVGCAGPVYKERIPDESDLVD